MCSYYGCTLKCVTISRERVGVVAFSCKIKKTSGAHVNRFKIRCKITILSLFCFRIIEFKDEDTAKKAVEKMHKYDLKTRKIIVREVSTCALLI